MTALIVVGLLSLACVVFVGCLAAYLYILYILDPTYVIYNGLRIIPRGQEYIRPLTVGMIVSGALVTVLGAAVFVQGRRQK